MDVSLIDEVRSLIGAPPAGLEALEYVFLGILLMFLVSSACSLIGMIFKWIGGGIS